MADEEHLRIVIIKPGALVFGSGEPRGWDIGSSCPGETIVQVACGEYHSAIVCASGRVYTFYQHGTRSWMENAEIFFGEPKLLTTLGSLKVTQAACGHKFSMFLTNMGKVYSCGKNAKGQLGLGHTETTPSPTLVTGLPPVKKVVAGYDYTVVLTVSGEVWVCGHNRDGELGLGHTNLQSSFTKIPNLPELIRPIDISCGSAHTALLSASQVLMITGWNEWGQLGLGTTTSISSFTPLLEPPSAVAAVSCGWYHSVTLRVDGTVWVWGYNNHGQLGTGDTTNRSTPTQMKGLENHTITQVVAGCFHTALLTEEGEVLLCGRGEDGELGQGKKNLLVPTLLPKSPGLVVKQVAFAEKYSLMLVEEKPIIAPTPELQCGLTLQDHEVRQCLTNMEKSFMRSLECPVCFKMMCSPIHMCLNGHSLCNACQSNANITACPLCKSFFGNVRNISLESLSMEIQLPCMECAQLMPACELETHAEVCLKRKYSCPVDQSCGWRGLPDTMLAHTSSAHPDQTWQDLPHVFLHSTADELIHTDVLAAHDQVFTLHRAFNKTTGELKAVVRYIGPPEDKCKFQFELSFITAVEDLTLKRNLCADIESIENAFQSPNCLLLKRKSVNKCLQQGHLVCRAAILNVESSGLSDKIRVLLSGITLQY